jgi:MFS family permease
VALYADKLVARGTPYGYELVVGILAITTTMFFLLHGLCQLPRSPFQNIYYIFLVRNLYSAISSPIYSIIDGIALKYLTEHGEGKEGYGKERMYGAISWAIISLILGGAIDYFTPKIMYLFITVTLFPLLLCIWTIGKGHATTAAKFSQSQLEDEEEYEMVETPLCEVISAAPLDEDGECHTPDDEGSLLSSDEDYTPVSLPSSTSPQLQDGYVQQLMTILLLFFTSAQGIFFILLFLVLRMGTSIVESLIFLFFTNGLGSSNLICGISVVVTVIFEIPIFHFSSCFLSTLKRDGLMILGCLAYSTRVVGYTLLTSPWYILFLEPLHGITYGFSTIASVDYVAGNVPANLQATGQGVLGSLQSVGTLVGVGLGGYVEERFGSLVLYRGAGIIVGVVLCLYVLVFVWTKHLREKK